jgi:hypothetical protein
MKTFIGGMCKTMSIILLLQPGELKILCQVQILLRIFVDEERRRCKFFVSTEVYGGVETHRRIRMARHFFTIKLPSLLMEIVVVVEDFRVSTLSRLYPCLNLSPLSSLTRYLSLAFWT